MKPIKGKYKITKDVDGCFKIYKKNWLGWYFKTISESYEEALKIIDNLEFVRYVTTTTYKDKEGSTDD